MLREAISESISFVRRQLTNPSFTQIQIHTTSTWNSGQSCHNVCIHSAKVPLKCFLLNREIFWVQWQRIKYELHVFDWLSGCCYDTGQHTRPSHWLPKCSQVLYFTHKMCSRGICHRASCKPGGVEECQRIAGWVIWRRGLSAFFVVYRTPLLCVCSRGRMLLPATIISLPPPP